MQCHALREGVEGLLRAAGVTAPPPAPAALPWFAPLPHPAAFKPSQAHLAGASIEHLVETGKKASLENRRHLEDPTLLGLHEMICYGLRGLAAYAHHAEVLGHRDPEVRQLGSAALLQLPRLVLAPAWTRQPWQPRPKTRHRCLATSLLPRLTSLPASPHVSPKVDAFIAEGYAFLCSEASLDLCAVRGALWGKGAQLAYGARGAPPGSTRVAADADAAPPADARETSRPPPTLTPRRRWQWSTPRAPRASRAWPCWTPATPPSLATPSPRRRGLEGREPLPPQPRAPGPGCTAPRPAHPRLPCPLSQVRISPKRGKAILISGHDLQDTHDLLVATEGTGARAGFAAPPPPRSRSGTWPRPASPAPPHPPPLTRAALPQASTCGRTASCCRRTATRR